MDIRFKSLENIKRSEIADMIDVELDSRSAIDAVMCNSLVAVWDDADIDEEQSVTSYHFGFLQSFEFDGLNLKFVIMRVNSPIAIDYDVPYQHAAVVKSGRCPKVFMNDGSVESIGRLVGAKRCDDKAHCTVRLADTQDNFYRYKPCTHEQLVECCRIELGIDQSKKTEHADV